MCQTKYWKNISATVTIKGFRINAMRSDNFLVMKVFHPEREAFSPDEIVHAFLLLETYRSCACNSTYVCSKHNGKGIKI